MRKFFSAITCLFLLAYLSTTAYAAETIIYQLYELDMSIAIPSDYVVFTRDIKADDPNLSTYGLTKNYMTNLMETKNIYLNAWDKDLKFEIIVTMIDSSLGNFAELSESALNTLASSTKTEYANAGITLITYEIYQHSQTKFIKIYISQPFNGSTVYGLQYYTVYNNKAINITMQSYSGKISSSKETILKSIVDSAHFKTEPVKAMNSASLFSLYDILFSLVVTVVVYSLPIIIYRYLIRKEPVEKKRAKIIVIIYGIISFIVMSALIFILNGSGVAGGAILLWSWINYKVLISGKKKSAESEFQNNFYGLDNSQIKEGNVFADNNSDYGNVIVHNQLNNDAELTNTIKSSQKSNFCWHCGFKLVDGSKFCSNCGTRIEK